MAEYTYWVIEAIGTQDFVVSEEAATKVKAAIIARVPEIEFIDWFGTDIWLRPASVSAIYESTWDSRERTYEHNHKLSKQKKDYTGQNAWEDDD